MTRIANDCGAINLAQRRWAKARSFLERLLPVQKTLEIGSLAINLMAEHHTLTKSYSDATFNP
jgi:hypothetical protein